MRVAVRCVLHILYGDSDSVPGHRSSRRFCVIRGLDGGHPCPGCIDVDVAVAGEQRPGRVRFRSHRFLSSASATGSRRSRRSFAAGRKTAGCRDRGDRETGGLVHVRDRGRPSAVGATELSSLAELVSRVEVRSASRLRSVDPPEVGCIASRRDVERSAGRVLTGRPGEDGHGAVE